MADKEEQQQQQAAANTASIDGDKQRGRHDEALTAQIYIYMHAETYLTSMSGGAVQGDIYVESGSERRGYVRHCSRGRRPSAPDSLI